MTGQSTKHIVQLQQIPSTHLGNFLQKEGELEWFKRNLHAIPARGQCHDRVLPKGYRHAGDQ